MKKQTSSAWRLKPKSRTQGKLYLLIIPKATTSRLGTSKDIVRGKFWTLKGGSKNQNELEGQSGRKRSILTVERKREPKKEKNEA